VKFTDKQLADFRAFYRVQKTGKHNMLWSSAREAAGMERAEYMFVIKNYEALRQATETQQAKDAAK
jgi:hypothetical protein